MRTLKAGISPGTRSMPRPTAGAGGTGAATPRSVAARLAAWCVPQLLLLVASRVPSRVPAVGLVATT